MTAGIYDETYQEEFIVRYPYEEIIFSGTTAYQKVDIIRTKAFGRCLFLDGTLNSAEFDEFVYHEGIVHPAMVRAKNRKRVLIIGGAEGGPLREVLKFRSLESVVMVDIDEALVGICRKYLADIYGDPFSDPRTELIFGDGRAYIENGKKFDVIIVDLNEAVAEGPAQRLFTKEFYRLICDSLEPGGIVAVQSEWLHSDFHFDLTATHRSIFAGVLPLEIHIPSYLMSEAINLCARDPGHLQIGRDEIEKILDLELSREERGGLRYYAPEIDGKIQCLPRYIQEGYKKTNKIFSDTNLPVYYDRS